MNRPDKLPSILDDLVATRETQGNTLLGTLRQREDDATAPPSRPADQRSLFGEILDWMMVPLLLLWPLSVAITFVIARSIADGPFDRALEDRTRVLAQHVRFGDGRAQVRLDRDSATILSGDDQRSGYIQVLDPQGLALLGETDLPAPALYDYPQVGVIKLRQDVYRGEELRIAYQYVEPVGAPTASPPVLVQVAETPTQRTRLANEIIKGVILPQFLILPMALALVWFGLGRGLRPLRLTQEKIHARRPDDLSPLDRRSVPQEIAPLVDGFNELLTRLTHTLSEQRRFIANAAHQMKTPLAGLHTQAELALRETDPAQVRRSMEQLAQSSGRAAHLISQLLAMARIENLRDHAVLDVMDLNPLARAVVTEWADPALARRIDFGLETDDEPAPIAGHPILLHEMIGNLLDNALRYTPKGGTVTVRVKTSATQVFLEVEDDGPGIPVGERALVFERFYRVLGNQADGSGLGLSIVREITARHEAEVELHDAHAGRPASPGTLVVVKFPKVQEA